MYLNENFHRFDHAAKCGVGMWIALLIIAYGILGFVVLHVILRCSL